MRYLNSMLLLVLLWLPNVGRATAQEPDLLLYQGDTLLLQANPLEQWLELLPKRPAEFRAVSSTACWRSYQATWQLEDKQLYLLRVVPCAAENPEPIDLRRWFVPDAQGRVAATWVTGRLAVALGNVLCYEPLGYTTIYERDWLLTLRQGQLTQQQIFDNQSCRHCGMPAGQALAEQVYQAIDWHQVPRQQGQAYCLVVVKFQPDSTGHSSQITLVKKAGWPYDSLASVAARTLAAGEWGACYRFGRWLPYSWSVPVRFSEANRQRYYRRRQPRR